MSETIVRPNGKAYRRRSSLRGCEFGGDSAGYLVLGTHDVERAREAFLDSLTGLELLGERPTRHWLREVPWDQSGHGDWSWIEDEVRGTPCVVWETSW